MAAFDAERQAVSAAESRLSDNAARQSARERPAHIAFTAAVQRKELRVFAYRLALPLPWLLIAGYCRACGTPPTSSLAVF